MPSFIPNPIPLVTNDDYNINDRIKEYRRKSDITILYQKYKTLKDLEADYDEYMMMNKENRVIADIISIEYTGKNNIERANEMRLDFYKHEKSFDPIKGYVDESFDHKVDHSHTAHTEYLGISQSKLDKYQVNFSNVMSGMFLRLESPIELIYFNYHYIDVIQNTLSDVNTVNIDRTIFSNYHDKKTEVEREYFKDKNIGIVCFNNEDKTGYLYCQDTDSFYFINRKNRPPVDHTKGMSYGALLLKESKERNIPLINNSEMLSTTNISKQEAFYNYAINSDILTEHQVLNYMIDKYPDNPITSILKTDVFDREKDGDKISVDKDIPYYTPQQMYDLGISYHSKTPLYSPTPDCISINEKDVKKWYEEYKLKLEGYNSPSFTSGYEWRNVISNLYRGMDELEGQALLDRKQSILDLGWNPEIPFDEKARKFAREKIVNYLKSKYKANIVDYESMSLSNNHNSLLKESTDTGSINIIFYDRERNGYKKCGIAFNESLDVYRFDGVRVYDHISNQKIYTCCLPQNIINNIFTKIRDGKLKEQPTVSTPFYAIDTNRIAEDKFRCMLKLVNAKPVELHIASISNPKYVTEGTQINSLVSLTEVKEFPVDFDKDGNMLIKKGKKLDYEAEYAATHLAMKQYHKSKNVDGMEYCMCKLWYLNLMISEEIHNTKNKDKLKKLHKARAKIMNDIHTYMPYILELDPDFNIEQAYEESPFSDHTIKINKSVIDTALALLKGLIKLVV